MINLLKQALLFVTFNLARSWFRFFFLIINVTPLILYLFFGFSADNLINYYILETILYCLVNMLYIKAISDQVSIFFPLGFIKILLVTLSVSLMILSAYFIPVWNKDETPENRVAFWNYAALLFSFHTLNLFAVGDDYLDWKSEILKRNVVIKFGILTFVAFSGTFLSKYIKSDIAFIISMIGTKTVIDLFLLHGTKTANR